MKMDSSTRQKQRMPNPKAIPSYVLDDLSSRFIINKVAHEINNASRLFFHIETAYWFYLDFHRVENPKLKDCTMKEFSVCLIHHCTLLNMFIAEFDKHFEDWKLYKRHITTCGAIILDQEMKCVLLVQSYSNKNNWGFPKGKINANETSAQCAIREVLEETGFDITPHIQPDEFLEREFQEQKAVLFLVPGISVNQSFSPRTRREIRDIQWFPLDSLPTYRGDQVLKEAVGGNVNLYTVMPYIRSVKNWIHNRLQGGMAKGKGQHNRLKQVSQYPYNTAQENQQGKKGKGTNTKYPGASQQRSGVVRYSKDTTVKQGRRGMTISESLFGNKEAMVQRRFKMPEIDTSFFFSKAWFNFRLDTDSMLANFPQQGSYYLPSNLNYHREGVGIK